MWLLLVATLVSLQNCGTRKKESRQQLESVYEIEKKLAIETKNKNIQTNTVFDISEYNVSINPINDDKPMQFVSGKDTITSLNASININKKQDKSTVNQSQQSQKASSSNQSTNKQKNSQQSQKSNTKEERKGNPWNWVAIIATSVFSLAIIGYFYFKKTNILGAIKNIFKA